MPDKIKRRPWDFYYSLSKQYFDKHGNLNFDLNFTVKDIKLGKWLGEQRKNYKNGRLKNDQISKLEKLEIEWDGYIVRRLKNEEQWNNYYEIAKDFFNKNGDLLIRTDYEVNGIKLGSWIKTLRQIYKGRITKRSLTKSQIERMDAIGMIWNTDVIVNDRWDENYELACIFFKENKHLSIPELHTINGKKIGVWIRTQRKAFAGGETLNISESQISKLNEIGMVWKPHEEYWSRYFGLAEKFFKKTGTLNIPFDFEMDGLKLGNWISVQRQAYNGRKDVKITNENIERLESIGMVWNGKNGFQTSFFEQVIYFYCKYHFKEAINSYNEHGFEIDVYIPSLKLGIEYDGSYWHEKKYASDNKKDIKCKELGIKLIRIRELPLRKTKDSVNYFLKSYNYELVTELLQTVFKEQLSIKVDIDIRRDMFDIVKDYKSSYSDPWYAKFECAKAYYQKHGDLLIPRTFTTDDGVKLGGWILNQRRIRKALSGTSFLTEEKVSKLNEIDMVWDVPEHNWNIVYGYAKQYYSQVGHLDIPEKFVVHKFKLGSWIYRQRRSYALGEQYISKKRIEKLNAIGMLWKINELKAS